MLQQDIYIVLIAIFVCGIAKQILFWLWLWQLKEYRFDRLLAHFQDIGITRVFFSLIGYSSLRLFKSPKFTFKTLGIGILAFLVSVILLVLTIRVYEPEIFMAITSLNYLFRELNFDLSGVFSGLPAIKNLLLNIVRLLADYALFISILITIFLFMPIIILLSVAVMNVMSGIFKSITISRATKKISALPNLKVIGITGSYGKSVTKEILADILSKKYKVLRTPMNINTAIGISQLILDKLDSSYEIFVVEMGAYKTGEIKEICDIVKPSIGIITAINEQHLALFGNINNTIRAKFELIDSLPKDGLAILNAGDKNIQSGIDLRGDSKNAIKAKIKLYSVGAKSDIYAIGEACGRQNVKFKYIEGATIKDVSVNISGCHNISNLLAVMIAAKNTNIDIDEIIRILQRASYINTALKNTTGPNGSSLIDDTYNSNPNGVFAALDHVKGMRGRKIVVMSSLIELGAASRKIHKKIGRELSGVASEIIMTDNYYFNDIRLGINDNKDANTTLIYEKNIKKIADRLTNDLKPSDTVLFINRGAGKVLEMIKK